VRTRQAVAIGVGILVLILLVIGIRGCLNARKEQAFKDYVTDTTDLVNRSNQQSKDLFGLLREPGNQGAVDLQNAVNAQRVESEQIADQAKKLDHPDELNTAQRYLVDTLEFRRDGISAIADQLPTALGDQGQEEATSAIAAQMRNFDTSDVIYSQRFYPQTQAALKDEDLLGEVEVPKSQFLPDIDWLRPNTVNDRISRVSGGGGNRPATPGLHGTGLGTVTVKPGGVQLQQGAATEVKVSEGLAFEVQVSNQGENDEQDVTVKVSVRGGARPITVERRLDAIAQGETKTVTVPLADTPPTGRPATVSVVIEAVPGEQKTDNNKGTFPVVFTR
jgi:CARDB